MSLSKVITEINKIKPFATEDTNTGNPATLTARRGRKRNAVDQLKLLKRQYRDELLRTATYIVVTGSEQETYTKAASTENLGNCFSADPEEFYVSLAEKIDSQLYSGKPTTASLFEIVGRVLENKALELDVIGYPQLIYKQQYAGVLTTKQDLINLLKKAINDQVGPEFAGIQAIHSIVDLAIDKNHSSRFTPVVLGTNDPEFAISLAGSLSRLGPKVNLVVAGRGTKELRSIQGVISVKEVNEETVKNSLNAISKSLKG